MTGPLGEEVIVLLDFQFFRETNVLNMAFIGISTAFSFAYYCTQYILCMYRHTSTKINKIVKTT